jgi:hypothetical protein
MKVQLNYTSFKLSSDTESAVATPGLEKFCYDHGIPIEFVTVGKENHIQWDDSTIVDIPCITVDDLNQYCNDYKAEFSIRNDATIISFVK